MDKLSVLQKMAFAEGSSAKIFKAIADPPTTSLQRLKVCFYFIFIIFELQCMHPPLCIYCDVIVMF